MTFNFENSYENLPPAFYEKVHPFKAPKPSWVAFNSELAKNLGLNISPDSGLSELLKVMGGSQTPKGASLIAMAYAGHQFGHFVPQLGDGRALLLGEVIDPKMRRWDLQLKGSGQTPFSRRGDGRSALGPVVREYILSEAMHALGIPSTRALAAIKTGEIVERERPQPGGIFLRVASSHIRIGTFEYFAAREDFKNLKMLADYTISRHYPNALSEENPYLSLLDAVIKIQARLVASWLHIGFIHGVMNTDNTSISGETIDYGPCAFMNHYDPDTVFSSIDHRGRYRFIAQPQIAQWNLACLGQALLPLIKEKLAELKGLKVNAVKTEETSIQAIQEKLGSFIEIFESHWYEGMRKKLGLEKKGNSLDATKNLIFALLKTLHENKYDYTNAFQKLNHLADNDSEAFPDIELDPEWVKTWLSHLHSSSIVEMKRVNPVYIPRNHQVENAIQKAVENSDYSQMKTLMEVLSKPFNKRDAFKEYALPPANTTTPYKTFCGT